MTAHHVAVHRRPQRHASAPRAVVAMALMLVSAALLGCQLDVTNPNSTRAVLTPTAVFGSRTFVTVSSGFFHSCALDPSGAAWCWGSNQHGQLGTGTAVLPGCAGLPCSRVPLAAASGSAFRQLSAGTTHTCGITTAGATLCWGASTVPGAPLLGNSIIMASGTPVTVTADSMFAQIAVGGTHACALTASGQAWCWGRNEFGQLGDSSALPRATPVPVAGGLRFASITTGGDFTCAVDRNGAGWCWGANAYGQLGIGDAPFNTPGRNATTPRPIPTGTTWRRIAAGGSHACGITAAGTALCWGRNNDAHQLGDSTDVTHRGTPGPVAGGRTYESIIAGAGTTCARTPGGANWCWGGNFFGGVGNGRSAQSGEPVPVQPLMNQYVFIAPGASHSCGIDATGIVKCWGDSVYGQIGIR